MSEFNLYISTPEKTSYDGNAEMLILKTISGDVGILKGRTPYISTITPCKAKIKINGEWKYADCGSGVLCVSKAKTIITARNFKWI